MPDDQATETSPSRSTLAWQGWRLRIPATWNPGYISGSFGTGMLILADLKQRQLEMNWKKIPSAGKVDFERLKTDGSSKDANLGWQPIDSAGLTPAISRGRRAIDAQGRTLVMLLSAETSRLLFLRFTSSDRAEVVPARETIVGQVADVSNNDPCPWEIFGFSLAVPAGFVLKHHVFAAGRATLTFRRRRQRLTFHRWSLAASPKSEPSPPAALRTIEHRGHQVIVRPVADWKLWDRLITGQACEAVWTCPDANRQHRIRAVGKNAQNIVDEVVKLVSCHQLTA
jgi:hypothetical protein